jgi:hypothetical protein
MKKRYLSFALLVFILSCSKTGIQPTSLQITVRDNTGNIASGASVYLFASNTDLNNYVESGNSSSSLGVQTTDLSGNVTFTNLTGTQYYFYATSGCENNVNGTTGISTLIPNTKNLINCSIESTGTLKLVSTSSNPYEVYVNGVIAISSMAGGTTQYVIDVPTGSYSIQVIQLSGYLVTPTNETFTGNVTCGSTLVTTFP